MSLSIKTITAVSDLSHPGLAKLEASLIKHGYDYAILHNPNINWNWGGLADIYEWCKAQTECTHFLYTDGFDTVALGGIGEVIAGYHNTETYLYSGEKACFPRTDWADRHPESTKWRYLNHGQFIAPIDKFLADYEGVFDLPITCQEWAMERYLKGVGEIDTDCKVFQSMAFDYEADITERDGRLLNTKTHNLPVFAHGNGRTDINWVYELTKCQR